MATNSFGRELRRARRSVCSQAALADYLGYSRAYINQIEHGTRAPLRPDEIRRVSDFLNYDYGKLYCAAVRDRGCAELVTRGNTERAAEVATTLARCFPKLNDDHLERIERLVVEILREGDYEKLFEDAPRLEGSRCELRRQVRRKVEALLGTHLDEEHRVTLADHLIGRFRKLGFKADQELRVMDCEIEAIRSSEEWRRWSGITLFDNLARISVPYPKQAIPLSGVVEDLAAPVEAKTRFRDGKIEVVLGVSTHAQLERGAPRAFMTLLHELAHAFLHTRLLIARYYGSDCSAPRLDLRDDENTEVQANRFAAAVAMPAPAVDRLLKAGNTSVRWMATHFGVSAAAMEIRLRQVRDPRLGSVLLALYQ